MSDLIDGELPAENAEIQAGDNGEIQAGKDGGAGGGGEGSITDWRESLPEEIRGDASLAKFKNLEDFAKSYKSMETLIGKKTVGLPDQNSSEEDWNRFYNQLGRPDTAEKYVVKRADSVPEEMRDPEGTKSFLDTAHKLGLTQKQVEGLFAEYDRQVTAGLAAEQQRREAGKGEVIARLTELYGRDVQANVERAEQALNVIDPDNKIDRGKLKNNVEVIQLLNEFGKRVLGDQLQPVNNGMTGLEEQIADVMSNPAFANQNHVDHDRIMAQYKMLQQQKYAMKTRQ